MLSKKILLYWKDYTVFEFQIKQRKIHLKSVLLYFHIPQKISNMTVSKKKLLLQENSYSSSKIFKINEV